ncbi:Peptidase Inhibitor 16 [Manis pentadactyla]|nr:Peptidase Inhibitor 16 [Manis pentadactyla]
MNALCCGNLAHGCPPGHHVSQPLCSPRLCKAQDLQDSEELQARRCDYRGTWAGTGWCQQSPLPSALTTHITDIAALLVLLVTLHAEALQPNKPLGSNTGNVKMLPYFK